MRADGKSHCCDGIALLTWSPCLISLHKSQPVRQHDLPFALYYLQHMGNITKNKIIQLCSSSDLCITQTSALRPQTALIIINCQCIWYLNTLPSWFAKKKKSAAWHSKPHDIVHARKLLYLIWTQEYGKNLWVWRKALFSPYINRKYCYIAK